MIPAEEGGHVPSQTTAKLLLIRLDESTIPQTIYRRTIGSSIVVFAGHAPFMGKSAYGH